MVKVTQLFYDQLWPVGDIGELVLILRAFNPWDCGIKWKLWYRTYIRDSMKIMGLHGFHVNLNTLVVNIMSMTIPHGQAYGFHDKGEVVFLCYIWQDCWHQNPKITRIGIELRCSGASGIACSWFWSYVGLCCHQQHQLKWSYHTVWKIWAEANLS